LNLIKLTLERGKCRSWHKCIQIAVYGVLTRSDLFQDFKLKLQCDIIHMFIRYITVDIAVSVL